jgi:hypothetical protein
MENNFFTRLILGLIFLLEPVFKFLSWIIWIISKKDTFEFYSKIKNKMILELFKK